MKKILLWVMLWVGMLGAGENLVFAKFQDVPPTASYVDAVERLSDFGIINGDDQGLFRPDGKVSREQFVTMLVNALGFSEDVKLVTSKSRFVDVEPVRWSFGHIHLGYEKGLFVGVGNNQFAPLKEVTFAQGATFLVRARGDSLTEGIWPNNAIEKARERYITTGLNFRPNDPLPRWAVAVMMDNFLKQDITDLMKSSTLIKTAASDVIILGDATTNPELSKNNIITTQGIKELKTTEAIPRVGEQVRIVSYGDQILAIQGAVNEVQRASVLGFTQNEVTIKTAFDGEEEKKTLPFNVTYYYNGQTYTYETVRDKIRAGSSLFFGLNDISYDYIVVVDPIYKKPIVFDKEDARQQNLSYIKNMDTSLTLKDGKRIGVSDIDNEDLLYRVRDYNYFMEFLEVIDQKADGEITAILPDKIAPRYVKIDGLSYEIGRYFDVSLIDSSEGAFQVGDDVAGLIGQDNRLETLLPLTQKNTPAVEHIITADDRTYSMLSARQVLTNKGIYEVQNDELILELGQTFDMVIDQSNIVDWESREKQLERFVIESASENVIRVKRLNDKGNLIIEEITLPNGIPYYYRGNVQLFDQISTFMENNSVLIMAKNDRGVGYQYGVLVDSFVEKPILINAVQKSLGFLTVFGFEESSVEIIKNGEVVSFEQLKDGDVAYVVEDLDKQFRYIQIFDEKVEGEITQIKPSKASPQIVQIDGVDVSLGRYAPIEKLNLQEGSFSVGDFISARLGKDGKVVDVARLTTRTGPEFTLIIQADKDTDATLGRNQVITDLGVFNVNDFDTALTLGAQYRVVIDGAYIVKIIEKEREVDFYTVKSTVGQTIEVHARDIRGDVYASDFSLPNGISYYYKGAVMPYKDVASLLNTNSTVALARNPRGVGYEYGVILDPVISVPEESDSGNVTKGSKIGDITLRNYTHILKNGNIVDPDDINVEDIVYEVRNVQDTIKYIDVYDNKILGKLDAILPNRLSPRFVVVNGVTYTLEENIDLDKLNGESKGVRIGNVVRLLLGKNNEVVVIK